MDLLSAEHILDLLRPLLATHSPTGHEDEATEWILRFMSGRFEDVAVDEAGNVIARVAGQQSAPPVGLLAHKDEIGFIIKRIEPEGKIRVTRVGGSYPWKYGEGPVDLLGPDGVVPGILCFGALHCSDESKEIWAAKNSAPLQWSQVWIDARLSREELADRGIRPGVKGVVGRRRKELAEIGDYVGAFAIDDKALVACMLALGERLLESPPPGDVHLVASAGEEIGSGRAAYAAGNLPPGTLLALEVAPVLPEYDLEATPDPVILYKDEMNIYDESVCRELEEAARGAGFSPQRAVLAGFGSDLSVGAKSGRFARYGCIAIPTENTHGFEVVHRESLSALSRTVEAWIRRADLRQRAERPGP